MVFPRSVGQSPLTGWKTCLVLGIFLIASQSCLCAGSDSIILNSYLRSALRFQSSNPDTALLLAEKAYKAAVKSGDPLLMVDPYRIFANIYYYSGNQQLAIEYYFKAFRQLEENSQNHSSLEFLMNSARIFNNLGNCYFDLNMEELALAQYKKSLAMIDEANLAYPGAAGLRPKMLLLVNIGNMLGGRKEFSLAKQYYKMAEQINQTEGDIQVKAGLLEGEGVILMKEGKAAEALDFYNKALAVRQQHNDFRGISGTCLFFGDFYLHSGDVPKAKEWYLKAIATGREWARWQIVQIASDTLARLFQSEGDYRTAFEMNKLSSQLNDSIFSIKSKTNLTRLALQFEFDRQIKTQETKQQKEIDQQKNRKVFFIFLSTVLLLSSLVILLLFLNQRRKLANARLRQIQLDLESRNVRLEREQLEKELALKNKELTTNVMFLVQKNEFITDIAQRTKELINNPPEQVRQAFNTLVTDLQRNTDDKIWKEFEVRFRDVHEDFYRRLNDRFPGLTPNEKKLAAFLRLNMSTKDISAITFQSTDSIRIARSRLRKKLSLPSEENLISFLESI